MKHDCGCITEMVERTIIFKKTCKLHKEIPHKKIWVGLQNKSNLMRSAGI